MHKSFGDPADSKVIATRPVLQIIHLVQGIIQSLMVILYTVIVLVGSGNSFVQCGF